MKVLTETRWQILIVNSCQIDLLLWLKLYSVNITAAKEAIIKKKTKTKSKQKTNDRSLCQVNAIVFDVILFLLL